MVITRNNFKVLLSKQPMPKESYFKTPPHHTVKALAKLQSFYDDVVTINWYNIAD